MRTSRVIAFVAILIFAAVVGWYFSRRTATQTSSVTVYYTKDDGTTEVPWTVSAQGARNTAFYAATQAVAGPPSDVRAIRFPAGTHVLSTNVSGSTATVDLSADVKNVTDVGGEEAEFKALVWTMTALPGIDSVAIRVGGQQVNTLPGGHLELDEPLRRSDF